MKPKYIVGIGASAGGLEALEQFFANLAHDTGLGYVVIQHLSPDYKSFMAEILSKHTAMPVRHAETGMEVEANCVYLIPRRTVMTIRDGRLFLEEQTQTSGVSLPIDLFFRSLAEDRGEHAVGIILSGTGSDGTRGIRAIKETGGFVFAQDEISAKFDGMPRSAISTGLVDLVLPPGSMGTELAKLAHRAPLTPALAESDDKATSDILAVILLLIRDTTGTDFSSYKRSTILRRIERRVAVNHLDDLEGYFRFLQGHREEIHTLYREFLINVTKFFRDPEAFATLSSQVIYPLVESRRGQGIRVWVAGCATGEEAYTIAILFRECMEALRIQVDLKIFATDVDQDAIDVACTGTYSESIVADLGAERLQRFFTRVGDSYQISRAVRELVIFARHDVVRDPPFSRVDLISCRNLLIYFQPSLQRRTLSLFRFALANKGCLFLGGSESVGDDTSLFVAIDTKWKIFRSSENQRISLPYDFSAPRAIADDGMGNLRDDRRNRLNDSSLRDRLVMRLLQEALPSCLLLNDVFEVIHAGGRASSLLAVPTGQVTLELTKLVSDELALAFNTALKQVKAERKPCLVSKVGFERNGCREQLSFEIRPLTDERSQTDFYLVLFQDHEPAPAQGSDSGPFVVERGTLQRITDLESELAGTRAHLRATIEELETSNEELQATNEELLSANEELQSTNEELESVNEELITVNAEYQHKIEELTLLNNDMNNLLSSNDVGTIFLDTSLCIRKYTPAAEHLVNLIPTDIGRPISHISFNTRVDVLAAIREVLTTLVPREVEVQGPYEKWFLLRIHPYRTGDNVIKGIVMSMVEISRLKQAELHAQGQESFLRSVFESLNELIVLLDADERVLATNSGFHARFAGQQQARFAGFEVGARLGDLQRDFWDGLLPTSVLDGVRRIVRRDAESFQVQFRNSLGRLFLARARAIGGASEPRTVLSVDDITDAERT